MTTYSVHLDGVPAASSCMEPHRRHCGEFHRGLLRNPVLLLRRRSVSGNLENGTLHTVEFVSPSVKDSKKTESHSRSER